MCNVSELHFVLTDKDDVILFFKAAAVITLLKIDPVTIFNANYVSQL